MRISTVVVSIAIITIVLLPSSTVSRFSFGHIDKVYHFIMFAGWATAVRYDFNHSFQWRWYLLAGLSFAALTEVLQFLTDGRAFDWYDLLADALGVVAGFYIGEKILKSLKLIK